MSDYTGFSPVHPFPQEEQIEEIAQFYKGTVKLLVGAVVNQEIGIGTVPVDDMAPKSFALLKHGLELRRCKLQARTGVKARLKRDSSILYCR